ncbi:unnamed protein product [Camellia sinensis]
MVHLYQMMDLMSGYKNRVQGVVGLVFGNENSASSEDSYVERLLDRISNGVLAGDGRTVIAELQFVVAESRAAQLAFGAMGFPVLLSVLKEEHDDVEMVCGALETLVSALTLIDQAKALKNEVQPTLMNTDLLAREAESISLLLSLLQEAILTIPRGITRLMDMLMDREEIQKILVFEGAFEKIFSIIKEEGCSEGGVVVQDCLELLNNLIRNNASNQVLLRETMGFDPLISILKLRGSSYSFTQQKMINFLSALETIGLLIMRGPEIDTGKDVNRLTNKAVLVQIKNPDGQAMLASTLIPQSQPTTHTLPEEDVNMSFGSVFSMNTCSRVASVLSHVLKDNMQCKERVLRIELEEPTPSLGAPEPLLHRVVKYLALASCMKMW